jgi:hypothetical protein
LLHNVDLPSQKEDRLGICIYAREWCTVKLQPCVGESSAVVKPSAVDSEATNVRMISTQPVRSPVASVSTF